MIICLCFHQCKVGENNWVEFNDITNVYFKSDNNIYISDKSKKCKIQNNHCIERNEFGDLCKKCELSYYPDENGGCSHTRNCEISYNGNCLKCKEDLF